MVEHYTLLLNNSYIMMISNKFKLYYLKRRINVQAFEAGSEIIVVVSYLKLDVAVGDWWLSSTGPSQQAT